MFDTERKVWKRTLAQTALFSFTSRRTSSVFIVFFAKALMAFTALGARSLKVLNACKSGGYQWRGLIAIKGDCVSD